MTVGAELSLDAALLDATSLDPRSRERGIQNIAPALLGELKRPGPSWRAAHDHARGSEALEALRRVLEHDARLENRGWALVGLGRLGDPEVRGPAMRSIAASGEGAATVFQRECAALYLSFLGSAARGAGQDATVASVRAALVEGLGSEHDDVRFQAAVALAEVGGEDVEARLVAALVHEHEDRVRANIVCALALSDPPGPIAVGALRGIVAGDPVCAEVAYEAALALAGARHPDAIPQLVIALRRRDLRDRALEALAVFDCVQARAAVDPVRSLAWGWQTGGVTRVRAAYALARWIPDEGNKLLRWLRFHPKFAVRGAVEEAAALLVRHGSRDDRIDEGGDA
ncbi:MAG: HEAT repeat domain-containing protein [Nannocystaceae bacterium]